MRGGQRPFGTFPKIHPFWCRRQPSILNHLIFNVQVELEHKLARVEVERLKNEKVIMSSFIVFLTFNSSTWILKVQVYGIQLFMGSSISKTSTKTSIFSDPSWERGLRGCQEVRPARAGAQNDQGWGDHVKPDLLSKCLPFLLLLFSGERISVPRDAIADRLFRVGGGECGASKAGSHNWYASTWTKLRHHFRDQVSSLRSTTVEFEGAKHEIRHLQEEVEVLNSQVGDVWVNQWRGLPLNVLFANVLTTTRWRSWPTWRRLRRSSWKRRSSRCKPSASRGS